jgi:site-specific DNA-methyltransferase (adenine-specific)
MNDKKVKLFLGDNMKSLKELPDNSIDAVVTDPPYALTSIKNRFGKPGSAEAQYGTDGLFKRASTGFLNKEWDAELPSVDFWREVFRVLKPGGHVLSFGGSRTFHRMVVNIEDAGFEIRDTLTWLYGSGFPKSHSIGKAIDKLQGNEREIVGDNPNHRTTTGLLELGFQDGRTSSTITKGNSEWEAFGTALKPATEFITLARKPLSEKSIAENVLKWRTGGLNIDGTRVKNFTDDDLKQANKKGNKIGDNNSMFKLGRATGEFNELNTQGRFPANLILECICDEVIKGEKGEVVYSERKADGSFGNASSKPRNNFTDKGDTHTNPDCPCYMMDEQSGVSKSTGSIRKKDTTTDPTSWDMNKKKGNNSNPYVGQIGGASRFFYQAKVSKAERNMGLEGFEETTKPTDGYIRTNKETADKFGANRKGLTKNTHPTVKPVQLMAYLCRLITPPNGIVLDTFMGSGSTGIAARIEGFRFVGMEMDEDYFKIAEARIAAYEEYRRFVKK